MIPPPTPFPLSAAYYLRSVTFIIITFIIIIDTFLFYDSPCDRLFRMHKTTVFLETYWKEAMPRAMSSFAEAATNFADGRPFDLISAK